MQRSPDTTSDTQPSAADTRIRRLRLELSHTDCRHCRARLENDITMLEATRNDEAATAAAESQVA